MDQGSVQGVGSRKSAAYITYVSILRRATTPQWALIHPLEKGFLEVTRFEFLTEEFHMLFEGGIVLQLTFNTSNGM